MDAWMNGCRHACMHACMHACRQAGRHTGMYVGMDGWREGGSKPVLSDLEPMQFGIAAVVAFINAS